MVELTVRNDQLVQVREASRYLGQQIDKLERGDVSKIVIMNRSRMAAVLVTIDEYVRLANAPQRGTSRQAA
jgi:hypothetical protein